MSSRVLSRDGRVPASCLSLPSYGGLRQPDRCVAADPENAPAGEYESLVNCLTPKFLASLHSPGMTREEIETALDAGLLKFRQWPPVEEGRLWAVHRDGPTMLWKSRPHEFCIPVKIGKFRYRDNIQQLNLHDKIWVIMPTDACTMPRVKSAA